MLVAFTRVMPVDMKHCGSLTTFWRLSYISADSLDMKCEGRKESEVAGYWSRVGAKEAVTIFIHSLKEDPPSCHWPSSPSALFSFSFPCDPFKCLPDSVSLYIFSKHHSTAYLSDQQSGHILCSSDFCLLSQVDLKHYEIRTTFDIFPTPSPRKDMWHINAQ